MKNQGFGLGMGHGATGAGQEKFTNALKEIAENFKKTGKISQTLDDR